MKFGIATFVDDLCAVAFGGDELLLATLLGVWRHGPTSLAAHVPVGGAYRAAGGVIAPGPLAELDEGLLHHLFG